MLLLSALLPLFVVVLMFVVVGGCSCFVLLAFLALLAWLVWLVFVVLVFRGFGVGVGVVVLCCA